MILPYNLIFRQTEEVIVEIRTDDKFEQTSQPHFQVPEAMSEVVNQLEKVGALHPPSSLLTSLF